MNTIVDTKPSFEATKLTPNLRKILTSDYIEDPLIVAVIKQPPLLSLEAT